MTHFASLAEKENPMTSRPPLMTIADLISHLEKFEGDAELDFSGLDFLRLKLRGDKLVQVEFGQQVYRLDNGEVVVENFLDAK